MDTKNKKVVQAGLIFDMDGVLIHSHGAITLSFNKVLKELGLSHVDSRKRTKGVSLKAQMEELEEKYKINIPISPEKMSMQMTSHQFEIFEKQQKDLDLFNFLDSVTEAGFSLAVATSSTKKRAEKILEVVGIRRYFKEVITIEDVDYVSKPEPDIFLKAAEKLKLPPSACIVFEDAQSGIDAAKAAGMIAIGVKKYHPNENFQGEDRTLVNFSDISVKTINNLLEKVSRK